VLAPAGTPPSIVESLNREIARIMANAEVKQKFHSFGTDVLVSTPAELGRFLEKEVATIGDIVRQVGAKID